MTQDMPLLRIENLEVSAPGGMKILHGIDYTLDRGTIGALVGESGSGKTMAARSIIKLLPPGLSITGGRIMLAGEDVAAASLRRLRQVRGPVAGMVFQEPMVTLNPVMTIGTQMAEAMRLHTSLTRDEIRQRSVEMLERVQLRDPRSVLTAYPHEFSGGMRQRILLASVMMLRPKLLIADEPTTALDTLSQREVLDLMLELARDFDTAVLLITHNLGLVDRYTEHTAVLREGRVVESGSTASIVRRPANAYTKELIAAASKGDLSPPPRSGANRQLLEARGLTVSYRNRATGKEFEAVSKLDISVGEGETVAVVGGSGSGKTTLGRAMLGLVARTAGTVEFLGKEIVDDSGKANREARLACQLIFQDPYSSLDPRQRVSRIVREPLRHVPVMSDAQKDERVREVLGEVGLANFGNRYPHQLSGGQRQRVAIARALVRRPRLVVADEPVSALDMTIQAQVLDLIRKLQSQHGFACLFISHDLTAVRRVAQRVVVMQAGRIVEEGPAGRVLDAPAHDYTRALVEASPSIDPQSKAASAETARPV